MYFKLSCFLVAVEAVLYLFLLKKYRLKSIVTLSFTIIFFYGASPVFDALIFSVHKLHQGKIIIDLYSETSFFVQLLYATVLMPFGLLCLKSKKINQISFGFKKPQLVLRNKVFLEFFIVFFTLVFLYLIYKSMGYNRMETKAAYNTFYFAWGFRIGQYFWAFLFLSKIYKGFLMHIYTIAVLLFSIFLFEREPIVFLMFVFLYRSRFNPKFFLVIPLAVIGYFLIGYWKLFYSTMIISNNFSFFVEQIKSRPAYLSLIDPLASYALIYDYISAPLNIYTDYTFSYITNTYTQFVNIFFDAYPDHQSLGHFAKQYYTGGKYGFAFSMVLESMLNFWYFGPFILGLFLFRILKFLIYYIRKYGDVFEILFVTSLLTLVRTEMAVFLKLFLIPIILTFILFKRFIKTKTKGKTFKKKQR